MSEELERDSVWRLAEASELPDEKEEMFATLDKPHPVPNRRLQRRRLQFRKLVQSHEPHFCRTRSELSSGPEQPSTITTDGRSKAIFCMAASFSKKVEADRETASTISLYTKMCKMSEVADYAAKMKSKHPEARCIYVPHHVRQQSWSKCPDYFATPLRIYRPHVLSKTILPPLRGASLKPSNPT